MQIVSTYRLQFHKTFTFADAVQIIPYLRKLGITHVYASPYLKAVPGSTHGYDVIDQGQLNPEIGTPDDYRDFLTALKSHGLSHILDTVPNHMGIDTNDNFWWNDVLTHGQESKYANYFDIDWNATGSRQQLKGKVLLPVLGEPIADALKNGSLKLIWQDAKPYIQYHDKHFPVNPASDTRAALNALLSQQHYRLCHWRVAADEINYRRFFDITSLVGLQMQRQEVFDAAHKFTLQLIAEGHIDGLRVDHPDGLVDPKQYFQRLQAANGRPLFVSVEKILNGDETLPTDWPVTGTSGYDFVYAVNDLFVDSKNESALTGIYSRFVHDNTSYADWVYRNKCKVLDTGMYSEWSALTKRLDVLAQSEISSRDFTRRQLQAGLREVIACFPVYRSYVSAEGVSNFDVQVVTQATEQAAVRNPQIDPAVLKFIRDSVLLRYPVDPSVRSLQLEFAQRFQQLTSPVNAKGIEDSTFYIYNRLLSLNEVGGDPGRFGRDPQAIHRYFAHRQANWRLSLSTLSTHDTKRSEDVRARLNVLSEIPQEWQQHLDHWKQINAHLTGIVHPNDQYLLYQTLLGAWPLEDVDETFSTRICAYMQKAIREAKLQTSWTYPNQAYEDAVTKLVKGLLQNKTFLQDFLPFQQKISRLGMINSIAQTVLRLTAPGIADTYQGTELWDFSLVDPDNRRPVNYHHRQQLLQELSSPPKDLHDNRTKLWITNQLLQCRRQNPDLFLKGSYQPLHVTGRQSENLFAFARQFENKSMVVLVPRLTCSLPATDPWGNTTIAPGQNPRASSFKNVLDQTRHSDLNPVKLFANFPVAVLVDEN